MDALHPLLEAAVAALLLVGAAFVLVGAIGLVRFRDFYMRLHAPTKASTLGVGGVLAASLLWHWAAGEWALRELLIALFLFVTAPVSAHLMAQAALHLRVRSTAPPPEDLDRR
jgi:multicomponent K+:H+ antiporter subunit G